MRMLITKNKESILNHPAISNTTKADFVSEKYGLIKTRPIIDMFNDYGWELVEGKFSGARTKESHLIKHVLKFENKAFSDGDSVPQILLTNSHDRTSALHFHVGFYRFICENGLVIGDALGESVKIFHSGKDLNNNIYRQLVAILDKVPKASQIRTVMRQTLLTTELQRALVKAAQSIILEERDIEVDESMLVNIRRSEDKAQDLWTFFNRLQENALGDVTGVRIERNLTNNGQQTETRRLVKARAIKAIDKDIQINKRLFDAALDIVNYKKVG